VESDFFINKPQTLSTFFPNPAIKCWGLVAMNMADEEIANAVSQRMADEKIVAYFKVSILHFLTEETHDKPYSKQKR
jgi:hypothetical protein